MTISLKKMKCGRTETHTFLKEEWPREDTEIRWLSASQGEWPHPDVGLRAPELGQNAFLLFKPCRLWYCYGSPSSLTGGGIWGRMKLVFKIKSVQSCSLPPSYTQGLCCVTSPHLPQQAAQNLHPESPRLSGSLLCDPTALTTLHILIMAHKELMILWSNWG